MSEKAYVGNTEYVDLVISNPTSGEIIVHKHLETVDLSDTSSIDIPVDNRLGETYRYTIWVGANPQHFLFSGLSSINRHTFPDCTLSLKVSDEGIFTGLISMPLYFATGVIALPRPTDGASIKVPLQPRLIRYSNNFEVHLKELPSKVIYPIQIEIEDMNAAYDFLGMLTIPMKSVVYQSPLPSEGRTRSTRLSTLRISDANTSPKLSIVRADTGSKLFTYGIKELLAKKPDYNPECQFEYDIEIRILELPDNTHYAIEIIVDGWKVHSYEVILS